MKNKMTAKDMFAVMEAYENGKEIEVYDKDDIHPLWTSCTIPVWNWDRYIYRVKRIPKVEKIPYQTVSEFLSAQSEHGPYVYFDNYLAAIPKQIQKLDDDLWLNFDIPAYASIKAEKLMRYHWQDGKGCYNMIAVED